MFKYLLVFAPFTVHLPPGDDGLKHGEAGAPPPAPPGCSSHLRTDHGSILQNQQNCCSGSSPEVVVPFLPPNLPTIQARGGRAGAGTLRPCQCPPLLLRTNAGHYHGISASVTAQLPSSTICAQACPFVVA